MDWCTSRKENLEILHSSRQNTFKKIHCLDHVVGVLRYLACNQGQIKTRREEDRLIGLPHINYARQPSD